MADRIKILRQQMKTEGVDLVVLGSGAHLEWLTSMHPHADERPLLMCISADNCAFLMPTLEAESARKQTRIPFFEWSDADGPNAQFARLLKQIGADNAGHVALDETMRADFAALVEKALPQAKRQFSASTVGALRMRKSEDEYQKLKANAHTADVALQTAWAAMKPGMSESDVGQIIKESFSKQEVKPLFGIVGAGENGAFPHHQTGETLLKPGNVIVMDIGGRMDGYCSDITRMAVLGDPPDGYADVHQIVDQAVKAALAAARPGVAAKKVDLAARKVITDAGYGEFFVHRTGHGLGTEVHEPPYITTSSDAVLDEGMVFSIEPGIYLPGQFGIRLEEIVILRKDGPEILSDLSRDLVTINV
ncbi:Xaa-Pro peptidase family protein [uncultured Ruegeria sp.]|uniref:M24 family metallopeptidase n=1 Tax=uncultured Ruegeria sp. TaxID=259304 RepID=UPI00262D0BDD|nr:Xaa-Pro peptidase family protein [uncultured Ruegeria sp.]